MSTSSSDAARDISENASTTPKYNETTTEKRTDIGDGTNLKSRDEGFRKVQSIGSGRFKNPGIGRISNGLGGIGKIPSNSNVFDSTALSYESIDKIE
ncbi:15949_t:CDS:2 [Acaulospora colombiana]|uniref:15949_t:CDS:1 n=1 Tax=Acaulospora colombiana TaxID=27376 RepID=A0ACA9L7R0_9GLOM|nr:15949_t:CDS:2 [Acaulospora colombiana]